MFEKQIDDDLKIRIAVESDHAAYEDLIRGEIIRSPVDGIGPEQATVIATSSTSGNAEAIEQGSGRLDFAILYQEELAGTIGCGGDQDDWQHCRATVGYMLHPQYRGQGIVTRALRAVLDIVYQELAFDRIEITCDLDHIKSKAVAERVGFTLEGIRRHARWDGDHPVDYCVFSMLAEEWRARSEDN